MLNILTFCFLLPNLASNSCAKSMVSRLFASLYAEETSNGNCLPCNCARCYFKKTASVSRGYILI